MSNEFVPQLMLVGLAPFGVRPLFLPVERDRFSYRRPHDDRTVLPAIGFEPGLHRSSVAGSCAGEVFGVEGTEEAHE